MGRFRTTPCVETTTTEAEPASLRITAHTKRHRESSTPTDIMMTMGSESSRVVNILFVCGFCDGAIVQSNMIEKKASLLDLRIYYTKKLEQLPYGTETSKTHRPMQNQSHVSTRHGELFMSQRRDLVKIPITFIALIGTSSNDMTKTVLGLGRRSCILRRCPFLDRSS